MAESLELRTLLAANLSFVSAKLVDGNFVDAPSPTVGEQLGVMVTWQTEDLPADTNYRIDVSVAGVPVTRTVNFGHGQPGTGLYFATFVGNFARSGTHTVDIAIDVDHAIAETDEGDNTGSFTFTTNPVPDLPQPFVFPLAGTSGVDWAIGNYLDLDPRAGTGADFRGGPFHYDGHPGVDISPANFAGIDRGIAVLAAADGVVTAVQDGNPDRESGFSPVNLPSNFITIDHGNGWQSRYFHVSRDSITVQPGDVVSRGQTIALMGSSGASAGLAGGPHLHFDVSHFGRLIETFLAPVQYYVASLPYQADAPPSILDIAVSNYNAFASPDPAERMSAVSEFSLLENDTAALTYNLSHLRDGDTVSVRWIAPDGSIAQTNGYTQSGIRRNGLDQWVLDDLVWKTRTGTWTVEVALAGVVNATTTFDVVAGRSAPELRVRQNGELILDGRTSAIPFPDVAAGAVEPTLDFVLENHGGSNLTLSGLELPAGFSLVGEFPAVVAADAAATFTVQLDSAEIGYKLGDIRFTTNDSSEADYNFPLEGFVTGTRPAGSPDLTFTGPAAVDYAAGGTPVAVLPEATLVDAGATTFGGSQLIAQRVSLANSLDGLAIRHEGTGSGQVGVSGSDISFSGTVVGSVAADTDRLLVTFNAVADLTAIQAVARAVVYSSADLLSTAPRTVSLEFVDTDNLSSGRLYREIVPGTPSLSLSISDASISESGGASHATVVRTGNTDRELVVTLSSNDLSEATVPTAVTIPAGQSSVEFTITGVDDPDLDGIQTVTITASAAGFEDVASSIVITDDEIATPFKVTNTSDSGPGSLRQAILDANTANEPAIITFAIPDTDGGLIDIDGGSGLVGEDADADTFRIMPTTVLPAINNVNGHPITIDATSQRALTGDTNPHGPEIELDGSGVAAPGSIGILITGDNVLVQGITVHSFTGTGILATASADAVQITGSYIGTDSTGRAARANGLFGVVFAGATNSRLGGPNPSDRNVVAGNAVHGVEISSGASGITLQNNFIGVDAGGSTGLGNGVLGVSIIDGANIAIVGGNVISGNGSGGILVTGTHGAYSRNVLVNENHIGTNAAGNLAVPNLGPGIDVASVADITIGGSSVVANLISGNAQDGVRIRGTGNRNVEVSGNLIGTDITGTADLGNGHNGVLAQATREVTIGGALPDKRNVISGNDFRGVLIFDNTYSSILQNNLIGTTISGHAPLPNSFEGVLVVVATDLVVESNTISGNGLQGILIDEAGYNPVVVEWPEAQGGNGHFYVVSPKRTWLEAEAAAALLGTHLASVQDAAENQFLVDQVLAVPSWIGLSDHETADFEWSSGEAVTFTNWGATEPNGGGLENHAEITLSGEWNDLPEFFDRPAILEFTAAPDLDALRAAFGDVTISDNLIGLGADGISGAGNGGAGLGIQRSSRVLVRGNTIAHNVGPGAAAFNSAELSFTGNHIGTTADEAGTAGNANHGLEIRNSSRVTVGGTTQAESNLIAANNGEGILVWDNSSDVVIAGNRLGSNGSATPGLGNAASGIRVSGASRVVIGGSELGAGNLISGNPVAGIRVTDNSQSVTVLGNSIHDNGGLGIDLNDDGPTLNDPSDGDSGSNQLQNYPWIDPLFGGETSITGSLNSTPSATFQIEVFANFASELYAQGESSLGKVSVTTDANGDATFQVAALVAGGVRYTATATDAFGNTSEFSPPVTAAEDGIAPTSRALRTTTVFPTTAEFPIKILGSDNVGGSGIAEIEIYVSVNGGAWSLWQVVSATAGETSGSFETTVSFTGTSRSLYRFYTRAVDNAGNREPDPRRAQALFYLRDVDAPQSQVDSIEFDADSGLFTLGFSGTDIGGSIAWFDVYRSIDGAAPVRVARVRGPASGTVQVAGLPGTHTYRFYTIATDSSNLIEPDPGPLEDIVTTATYTPTLAPEIVAFDVQNQSEQRSYVTTLQLTFSAEDGLDELTTAAGTRIRLVSQGLNGTETSPVDLTSATFVRNGRTLTIHFGSSGLQVDGIYTLRLNVDNAGTGADEFEVSRRFHRLQGDADGDGDVDLDDVQLVRRAMIARTNDREADLNGDGIVSILDYLFAARNLGASLDPIEQRFDLDD
ncbi:MAG: right-handed parallel beta-helix repeat-containing protein [Planctomycetaceae bacterium]